MFQLFNILAIFTSESWVVFLKKVPVQTNNCIQDFSDP